MPIIVNGVRQVCEANGMSDVTCILAEIKAGDPTAADRLLPLVYAELRRLAEFRMSHESLQQTLQPTALVHEAYLRLAGSGSEKPWDGRGHFFAAAAEAMRASWWNELDAAGPTSTAGGYNTLI